MNSITQTDSQEQDFSYGEYFDFDDLDSIFTRARNMVTHVARRCKLSAEETYQHWDDLEQTALTVIYDLGDKPVGYITQAIKYALIDYVLHTIRGLQGGWRYYDIQGYSVHSIHDYQDQYGEAFDAYKFLQPAGSGGNRIARPVEEDLMADEQASTSDYFWHKVMLEFMYVLIGMRKQWRSESLYQAAQVLAMTCRGMSYHVIALQLGLPPKRVQILKLEHRGEIERFVNAGAVLQGIYRARGRLHCFHHSELTPDNLNCGHRYVVILPHGAFSVYPRYDKRIQGYRACIQANRRVNGKVKSCAKELGEVGTITYNKLFEKTLALQEKMAQAFGSQQVVMAN